MANDTPDWPDDLGDHRFRLIGLPGMRNMRDLGGLPTVDGRVVVPGRVFRSEALSHDDRNPAHGIWDPARAEEYRDVGLITIIDLRTPEELGETPSAWEAATGATVVALPMLEGGEHGAGSLLQRVLDGSVARFEVDDLTRIYRRMLATRERSIAEIVRIVADADRIPCLVHCSAGKDRTGVVVAVLLRAIGVPHDVVVEDYALTGVLRPDRVEGYSDRLATAGVDPGAVRTIFESPAAAMEATLSHLDSEWGSAEGFLVVECGVTPDEIDRLRDNLLTDS